MGQEELFAKHLASHTCTTDHRYTIARLSFYLLICMTIRII